MSPVRSQAQAKWLAVNRPDLLHKWQREAPRDLGSLPERVKRTSKHPRSAGATAPASRRPAGVARKLR